MLHSWRKELHWAGRQHTCTRDGNDSYLRSKKAFLRTCYQLWIKRENTKERVRLKSRSRKSVNRGKVLGTQGTYGCCPSGTIRSDNYKPHRADGAHTSSETAYKVRSLVKKRWRTLIWFGEFTRWYWYVTSESTVSLCLQLLSETSLIFHCTPDTFITQLTLPVHLENAVWQVEMDPKLAARNENGNLSFLFSPRLYA